MSSSVENKVVSLTFDNASFQTKVGDTLSMLDKLKQSLNFTKGKESMGELQAAAGKFDMSPMGTSIDSMNAKFAALATIGITAISNLTNKVVNAGVQMGKALTVTPLLDGLREYETNMNSIQTILANTQSKGTTLDQVNAALDQLNEYSDKTIYNFAEMARNIGTFTAAGVDLDTSVSSIKGIANLAAMSGSSSEQAATAMYQLSQAIAAGSVKLMDWNSVVNAGMGGEAFKSALFETGKAMGTITDVPLDQSFTQWEDAGNSFRESLQDGWITADVLTTTLGGLSGELSAAELSAKGFSDQQVVAIQKLADTATAAATEVKTASQLFGVIKEAIGTGWASTFRLVVGDFMEAKAIFTGLNNYIGGFIGRAADARNELLQGWKGFGGRDALVQGLVYALAALQKVLTPIKEAFREIFPRTTVTELLQLTARFRDFTEGLIISGDTANKIKDVFRGIFSILKIGVEIVKGVVSVFATTAGVLFGFGGDVLSAGAGLGSFISKVRELLVEGGGISKFFGIINASIRKLGEFVQTARDKIASLFGGGIPGGDQAGGVISAIVDKLSNLSTVGDKAKGALNSIGEAFKSAFNRIKDILETTWNYISDFFGGLGDRIAGVFTSDAFAPAMEGLKVGFLGGITALLVGFFKNGLKLDFGQLGFLDSITGVFDELGGTLKAFQTQIKADALIRIATAVAILTASVLVLSFIDSGRLAASLGALAIGFGQLVASMAVLAKIEANPAKMIGLAGSMILMAGAAGVLSIAIASLSRLDWGELAKGLAGVLGAFGALALSALVMGNLGGSFIRAGFSLIILSGALWVFSKVITAFSNISYSDMIHGLVGIAGALGLFVLTTNLINPADLTRVGFGLVLFAFGIRGIKTVVESFAQMSWGDMIKGFAGLAVGLALIVGAMILLPKDLGSSAIQLLGMAAALWVLSKAVGSMGSIPFGDMAKGLAGLAIVLLLVVAASYAMSGAIVGAAAMVVVSGALFVLGKVLESLGQLSIGQLVTALVGIAGVLLVLGLAAAVMTPILPALLGLGLALVVVGAGFALFGVGAALTAKALVDLGSAGKKSITMLIEVLETIIKAVPGFVQAFGEGIIELVQVLLDAAPGLIDGFGNILEKILDKIIEIMPKVGEAFSAIITTAIEIINEKSPDMIAAGIAFLISFLTGIRDNISMITALVLEIIAQFLQSVADNIGMVMEAASNLMVAFIQGLLAHALNMAQAGVDLLVEFLNGIANNISKVIEAAGNIIVTFITSIGNLASSIIQAGTDTLVNFLSGWSNDAGRIFTAITDTIIKVVDSIQKNLSRMITAGKDAALAFLDGLVDDAIDFADKAGKLLIKFLDGLTTAINTNAPRIRESGKKLAYAIVDGITGGIASKAKEVADSAIDLASGAVDSVKGFLGINSPSKVFYEIGKSVPEGFVLALKRDKTVANASTNLAKSSEDAFNKIISNIAYELSDTKEFNPTITPVLDLSSVAKDAKSLSNLIGDNPVAAQFSFENARAISASVANSRSSSSEISAPVAPTEVKFEQNNYSPKALTTSDIYEKTRSQIELAKEEMKIP